MPQITSVEPQKKNPGRYNIFLDGTFVFGADEDLVVNCRLVVGKNLQPQDVEKLLFEAEVGKLMERMYGLFSIRQRSEWEVRDYLKRLSFKRKIRTSDRNRRTLRPSPLKDQDEISQAAVDLLVERLRKKGMVDDLGFARSWVEARRRSKQKGKTALKAELYQKGIDREIIEEVISEQSTAEGEEELAKQALEKKMRAWKNLEPREKKQKAIEFLMRKGFEYEIIRPVVEKFMGK